jgi:hypothetical protein
MELKGKVIVIGELETFKNDFIKKNIVIETQDRYPQKIQIEFVKDNMDHLHNLMVGDLVTVFFNVRGREYQGKYYTSIEGWRVVNETTKPEEKESKKETLEEQSDDLPF